MSSAAIDPCAYPAGTSPDGIYNFIDPPSLKSTVYAVSCILTGIATLLTLGRLWVNRRKLTLADFTITASMVLGLAFFVVVLLQGKMYRHQWDIRACWFDGDYMKTVFCNSLFFGLCLGLAKVSILLLYLQLLAVERGMRLAVYAGLFFTVGLYITFIPCVSYYEAPHIGGTWAAMVTNGQPNQAVPWSLVVGAGSILIDLYIFVLPIPVLVKLHTSVAKRLQIIGLFSTALFGVAASIVALVYRVPLLQWGNQGVDSTWHTAQINIANLTECMVAISVACLPACVNLFRQNAADVSVWKSIKSVFTPAGSKYHSKGKSSGSSGKNSGRQERTVWGPSRPRNQGDTWELMETDGMTSQFDVYAQTAAEPPVATRSDGEMDARTYNEKVGITKTVDIYQQAQKNRESPDSFV